MLRVSKLTDAEYVLRDVAGGVEDYYLGCGEAPGVWAGRLADCLGLGGVVEGDHLRALVEGRDPTSGTPLVRDDGKRTVKAYDVTLSAPKSVSLLWAFATPETASVVSIAHVEAMAAALSFLDGRAGVTRQQSGGVRRRVATSGLAMATFVHRTSREGDPQLHTHCVIPNLVRRQDGSWVAIDGAALYGWAKAAGSIYQEELRRRLSERLGVAWGPDRQGCREMLGFTEAQLERFSKRTRQIQAYQAAKGLTAAAGKQRMVADERASLATRRAKDRRMTAEWLRGRWEREAAEVGLARGRGLERRVAEAGRGRRRALSAADLGELLKMLVDPEVGLCARDSRFGEAQAIERVAAFGGGTLTSEQIQRVTSAFLRSDRVVRLIDRDPSGRTPPRWSTRAHRRLEDRVLANLDVLRGRTMVPLPGTVVDRGLGGHGQLGEDQAEAVRVLAGPGPAVRALVAPAGHGKTTAVRAAAEVVRAADRPVVALATTNQAVGELRRAGLEAATVARFALDGCQLEADTVVILDELSQLPTVEADLVLSAVAGCEGGQLWLVGDPLQAQPVRAGGLGPLVADLVAAGHIPVATLTVNRRQTEEAERAALSRYRDGDTAASQQLRRAAGLEHEAASPERARQAMADAVVDAVDHIGAPQVAALAVTHADCEDLADRIRRRLVERGVIRGPALDGPGWAGSRSYQTGDRILLHGHLDLPDRPRSAHGNNRRGAGLRRRGARSAPRRFQRLSARPGCVRFRPWGRRSPAGLPWVVSHSRRRAGRHLDRGAPAGHRRVGPLPRLRRPVPGHRRHAHLEHQGAGSRRPRWPAGAACGHAGQGGLGRSPTCGTEVLRRLRRPLPRGHTSGAGAVRPSPGTRPPPVRHQPADRGPRRRSGRGARSAGIRRTLLALAG